MYGYGGNDTFIVDNAGDAAVEFEGHGTDLIVTSVNYVLGANVENMQSRFIPGTDTLSLTGNALANTIWGNFGDNSLDGGAGADTMYGYGGNDVYYVDNAGDRLLEWEGHGTDLVATSVSYVLDPNVENLQAAYIPGTIALSLTGNGLGNVIWGNFGHNSLDGGAGADVMYGYGGDDTFIVDNAGDAAVEFEGHGTDLVVTSVSYVLGANLENMQSRFIPGIDTLSLTGNALANTIWGNFGDNSLDGGAGADTMYGYGGNDTYYVDNADDRLLEWDGHGIDLVATSVSYVLDPNVENLQARYIPGTEALSLTGNGLANVIWGNFGNNVIDGGAGADVMYGYGGNDTFTVDNAGDAAVEFEGHGTDLVITSISHVLGANLESLQAANIAGTAPLSLTGNGLANVIWGNFGSNLIDGGAGADVMYGYGGDDTYVVDAAGDQVSELAGGGYDTVLTTVSYVLGPDQEALKVQNPLQDFGFITLTGNELGNVISGHDWVNYIDGKGGNDVLAGGDTRDEFHFTTALDASNNVDTIVDFNPASDLIVLAGGATDPFSAFASGWASWEIGTAAAGPGATLVYDPGTGSLSYDADGAGGLAAVLFAKLTPGTALGSNSISVSGPNTTQTITSATTLSVPENVPISTPIYRITASDPDGDALTYMLDGPNKWAFTVDPRTGDVRFVSSPDFEAMSKYEVQVIAKASSGEIASKFLTVTITDLVEAVDPYHLTDTEPNDSIFGAQTLDRAKFASTSETNVPDRPLPAATITGSISSGTDKDFYSIQLQAGEMLILDVDGTVTLDSELKVYGGGGVVIASNDDPGSFDPGSTAHAGLSHNMDSLIRVRAPTTGTYTFSIASFVEENGSTSQGAYTLHVVVAPPATEAQIEEENIQALLAGSAWDTLTLTYGFTTSGSQYGAGEGTAEIAAGMQSLNAAQQAAVRTILGQYSNVTNLSFNELTASPGAAHMRYALSSDPDTAHAYHPGPGDGGDSWYNISSYNNPVVGNYQWLTFIHETGHATGLKHGHESPALSPNRDSMEYSVMTYRSYTGSSVEDDSGFSNETWGYAQTLMMYDIAALQRLYGADFGYNAGDSVYSWDQNNGSFLINGVTQWIPGGNRILMTLWDGGGNDTYDLSNYVTAAMIDLRPGHFSKFSDVQIANLGDGHKAVGNVANALLYNNDPRSLIENVIGSSGNDAITGNNAVNRLTGGGGSDTFSFWTVSQSPTGAADTILDFLHGTDKIGLNGIDSISGTPGNDPFTYIGTAAFSGAAGELRVTASGGVSQIFADVNGDAIADLHIFVHAVIDQTDLFL
jgi:Ca2+-binding RTX toxin-like protein